MILILWSTDIDGRVSFVDSFDNATLAETVCTVLNRVSKDGTEYSIGSPTRAS